MRHTARPQPLALGLGLALVFLVSACGTSAGAPAPPSSPASGASSASASSSAPTPSAAGAPVPFAVGYPAPVASATPFYVGVNRGFFKRAGLDVSLKLLRGSGTEVGALASGSVQAVMAEGNAAVAAMARGVRVVFVGSDLNNFGLQLWARTSIDSVPGLRGKKIALSHVGSLTASAARAMLSRFGIKPSSVKLQYLGSPSAEIAAALAGKVDAVVNGPPTVFKLGGHGFHELYDLARLPHVSTGILVARGFLRQHPGEVQKFLKGDLLALAYLTNPANKATVLKIMSRYTHVTDGTDLDKSYSYLVKSWDRQVADDATIPASAIADSIAWAAAHAHKTVTYAQAVDLTPLHQVTHGGRRS